MAGPLAAIERFFERLFERPPARLFAARVEKEQLVRQLQRAMEAERRTSRQRTYAPSFYRVLLNPADLRAFEAAPRLLEELGEGLRLFARSRGYILRSRPRVVLEPAATVGQGEVSVIAETGTSAIVVSGLGRTEKATGGDPGSADAGDRQSSVGAGIEPGASSSEGGPRIAGHDPGRPASTIDPNTAVFEAARPRVPSATIAVHVPGRPAWRVPVNGGRLRIGRAVENDIVLPDDRVSRHHGQINVRLGTLVYSDLGSTNGSFLNGARVSEIALGPTDVLLLGRSSLTIEPGP
jgi:hypothetical protein